MLRSIENDKVLEVPLVEKFFKCHNFLYLLRKIDKGVLYIYDFFTGKLEVVRHFETIDYSIHGVEFLSAQNKQCFMMVYHIADKTNYSLSIPDFTGNNFEPIEKIVVENGKLDLISINNNAGVYVFNIVDDRFEQMQSRLQRLNDTQQNSKDFINSSISTEKFIKVPITD